MQYVFNSNTNLYICVECGKEYSKYGIKSHIWRTHGDGKNWTANNDGYKIGSRKGINQFIKADVLNLEKPIVSDETRNNMSVSAKKRANTPESLILLRDQAITKKLGGLTHGGRGKKGWYCGIWCDSSWELAYIVYNLNHNISVVRNNDKFPYIYNNRVKYYYPDFIVDNEYIEIKGYKSSEWYCKLNSFPYRIKVLYKDDIQYYLKYVIDLYGEDFIKLYKKD